MAAFDCCEHIQQLKAVNYFGKKTQNCLTKWASATSFQRSVAAISNKSFITRINVIPLLVNFFEIIIVRQKRPSKLKPI